MISHNTNDSEHPDNFKPDVVGGHNISTMRAIFDRDDKNIIVASDRQLFYYDIGSCEQAGRANLYHPKLSPEAKIVACERLNESIYVITNCGRIFVWSLETRDWINEISLPVHDGESLVSCKMLSKRQYIYTLINSAKNTTTLNYSMSRSERESPKQREEISPIHTGELNSFDLGSMHDPVDFGFQNMHKDIRDKLLKQRCLVYIQESYLHFQKVAFAEKLHDVKARVQINAKFTCVRANPIKPMVAAGDTSGRIYLYTAQGKFADFDFKRTKLHWHTMPVNDMCFSSTGSTLYSVGGESGCVVIWDISQNNIGQKRVVARLGMPIRYINCSSNLNQLVLTFEDNEIQFMDTSCNVKKLKTLTRRTIDLYRQNDHKALRIDEKLLTCRSSKSVGLLWHSQTDTVVCSGKTGWLQFYSPRAKLRVNNLNFLRNNILSLEKEAKVIPSDIIRASLTLDGDWIAFYETFEQESAFPSVRLHIWQRSQLSNRWVWIQTADRLHESSSIVDLRFSPDGHYLISVADDGTFHVLHRVCLDAKVNENSKSKQMYAKGFVGNVPDKLPAMSAFSQDSSVMAMSLTNDTTLIWMIVDPYKLVYECQLNQIETNAEPQNGDNDNLTSTPVAQQPHEVLGLHFGYHKPSQSLAPLCEVRSDKIRIWNILNAQETMEYSVADTIQNSGPKSEFTAAAFDQCPGDSRSLDHFAVSTNRNQILIFKLQISQATRALSPLITVDATMPYLNSSSSYRHMCFVSTPILDIDPQCYPDSHLVKLLNRLCLMNNRQELIGITDKLTLERESASNNLNTIKTFEMSELQSYFAKSVSTYSEETRDLTKADKLDANLITEKQRRIRNRIEVQKMLKNLLLKIPSQNLPKIEILGPMILDKLI